MNDATPVEAARQHFRRVLARFPTGVTIITAAAGGGPAGMIVGSFTSVSLDPPLVAFLPAKTSTSWPAIRETGKFCVNILSSAQEPLCRQFFASDPAERFANVQYAESPNGSPVLEGAIGWIDCDLADVVDAGDHFIVLGAVKQLETAGSGLPLIFFQGGYGEFSPTSITASAATGVGLDKLRQVDSVRGELEKLSVDLKCRAFATVRSVGDLIVVASASGMEPGAFDSDAATTLVGRRLPLVPPIGSGLIAWSNESQIRSWLARAAPETHGRHRAALEAIRKRGYSVRLTNKAQRGLADVLTVLASRPSDLAEASLTSAIQQVDAEPLAMSEDVQSAVRVISAPVFGPDGSPELLFTADNFSRPVTGIEQYELRVLEAADAAAIALGGRPPQRTE